MRKITLSNRETVEVECLSCAITSGFNQLCLGIIVSGIGFVLAQRTPFRFRDIRRRLQLPSTGVQTPVEGS
ncbi:hypothetical protein ACQKOF_14125 [Lysinibacillus sp. NPDC093190]|uniref:hypothetical protein n=1 Tax=Lysinibacillus sp. NPDC093190 TaxID=3390575 RepID=UPI003D03B038